MYAIHTKCSVEYLKYISYVCLYMWMCLMVCMYSLVKIYKIQITFFCSHFIEHTVGEIEHCFMHVILKRELVILKHQDWFSTQT